MAVKIDCSLFPLFQPKTIRLYLAELLGSLALVYTSHEYRGTPAGWQRSKRLKGLSVHGRRRGG